MTPPPAKLNLPAATGKPRLLVLELWGLGDLAIGAAFLRAAGERYAVTLLAKPYARDLQPHLWPKVQVIPFNAPWTAFRHKYHFWHWPWREILRLRRELSAEAFDLGASARWDPRDHLLLWLLGVHRRVGFPRLNSGWLLHQALTPPKIPAHRYEYWRRLGQALGVSLPAREQLPTPPRQHDNVILVHTGAAQPVRVWPLERYRQVVQRLRQKQLRVQVVCDPNQREWWLQAGEPEVATPRTPLELLALAERAAAFVGNDSGPGHLAALVGVPTFTLFGPQLPEAFAPLHPAAQWLEGAPCPYKPCSDYCRFPTPHCLWNLSTETVEARLDMFLDQLRERQLLAPVRESLVRG